ncbi:hypothetical protein EIN_154750 [Entamoeba invadens IP1]|uniref:Leucine rich repeat containing protein BspA family protein n=1 Tax=Entamoeba invadens IP1 TaxID=370355 RepID=A0A0A1UCL7_ENTIV|nr:hypothetical protein EIN_154750 [Entamoeba invadens IP1]ELP91398.1 hypothetical protein EIN_154750 [Entamoeba invadens IP1]|eukprot:XP_004258169.1 hypothetical protein EIN_154750 [Entamoeba invadens IP1]
MVVSKYFATIKDFINLEFVCKKYKNNMTKFHFNPIPVNKKTIKYFPNIETLNLWRQKDETFGNSLFGDEIPTSYCKTDFYRINVWLYSDVIYTPLKVLTKKVLKISKNKCHYD